MKILLYILLLLVSSETIYGQKIDCKCNTINPSDIFYSNSFNKDYENYINCLIKSKKSIFQNKEKLQNILALGNFDDYVAFATFNDNSIAIVDTNINIVKRLDICSWTNFNKGKAIVQSAFNFYIINTKGEKVRSLDCDEAGKFINGIAVIKKGGLFGVINTDGNLIIENKYDYLEISGSAGEILIAQKNSIYGLINKEEKIVGKFEFNSLEKLSDSIYKVYKRDSIGFINSVGKMIVPLDTYFKYYPIEGGKKIACKKGDKFKVYETSGKTILTFSNTYYLTDFGNYYLIGQDKRVSLIDKNGKQIFKNWYEDLDYVSENLIVAQKNNLVGVIDIREKIIIPFEYEKIHLYDYTNRNFIFVTKNSKEYWIDIKNKVVLKPIDRDYYNVQDFIGDFAIVYNNGGYGLINKKGIELFFRKCHNISHITKNLYLYITDSLQYNVIDRNNTLLLPEYYKNIQYDYHLNTFIVENFNNEYAVFDERFKQITGFSNVEIKPLNNNNRFGLLLKDDKAGLYDRNYKVVVQPIYDYISFGYPKDLQMPLFLYGNNIWLYKSNDVYIMNLCGNLEKVNK